MRSFLLLTLASAALAFHVPRMPSYLSQKEVSINTTDYPASTIDIPIDHYNASDTRTYKNRYWVSPGQDAGTDKRLTAR